MSKHQSQHGQKDGTAPENKGEAAGQTAEQAGNAAAKAQADGQNGAAVGDSAAEDTAKGDNAAQNQAENAAEGDPAAKIAELEAKLAEASDNYLRKAADFENFRKRMNQEKQNAIDFANQSLLLDIVPVIDDFERAIAAAESSPELAELPAGKALLEGVVMIEKRLTGQLESKWGLKRFNSAGEPFDPNRHEALMMEKSADIAEAVVQEDLIKGYLLKDRVIRAAKVKVLMPENG